MSVTEILPYDEYDSPWKEMLEDAFPEFTIKRGQTPVNQNPSLTRWGFFMDFAVDREVWGESADMQTKV